MTEQEFKDIVEAVLSSVRTNSRTIGQLTAVTSLAESDCFEVAGGKKVAYSSLRDLIAAFIAPDLKRSLYAAFGATWDGSTQRWSLNGLSDITDAEMDDIFVQSHDFRITQDWDSRFRGAAVRTNLFPYKPKSGLVVWTATISKLESTAVGMFANSTLETAVVSQDLASMSNALGFAPRVNDARDMFNGARKLKKVFGVFSLAPITNAAFVSNMFKNATALEEVSVTGLGVNISLADSPNLTASSVAFLCRNSKSASSTFSVTVTLHATAMTAALASGDVTDAMAYAYSTNRCDITLTDGTRSLTASELPDDPIEVVEPVGPEEPVEEPIEEG